MKLDPRLKRLLGFGLMGTGALTAMSGVVNMIAAYRLIDDADAASLGVSRNEFIITYAGFLVVGSAMVYLGWRLKREPPPQPPLRRRQ